MQETAWGKTKAGRKLGLTRTSTDTPGNTGGCAGKKQGIPQGTTNSAYQDQLRGRIRAGTCIQGSQGQDEGQV